MKCLHEDFDEYFGKCTECQATRKQVIAEQFINELQPIYGDLQRALGIESGDIAPETMMALGEAENALAMVVGEWLDNRYEREE